MSQVATEDSPLVLTSSAAKKVRELITDEGNDLLMLRIFVQGGGCSGFQYGFTFDESVEEGDTVVDTEGVRLLVDPMSVQYLMGAEIDFVEGIQGAQFVIRNPNVASGCGCGSSAGGGCGSSGCGSSGCG
ncbi:MAG: iron-sulfur cluster insertion protein ErpA [Gammaproteobacteria bacterium]|nr:iron-sulfur cluster insertion protein ErpA [Gammaproteobacteria bacterium]